MKTLHWAARLTGYVAGLIGMILFILGRQQGSPRHPMMIAGAVFLIVSFAAFLVSYVLYILQRLHRS